MMSLFGFMKKKTTPENTACTCGGTCAPAAQSTSAPDGAPVVKVLGGGCAACHTLMEHTGSRQCTGAFREAGSRNRFCRNCQIRRDEYPGAGGQ